jgi:pantoate--beta-alanine ligase
MVRPEIALFGQKDYQQAAVIRRLVEDLNMGVEIFVRPTVREKDGLAMSSRNVYLSPEQRTIAATLYKSLRAGAEAIRRGTSDVQAVQSAMATVVEQEPALTVDYLAVCDPRTLDPLSSVASRAVLLGAVRLGAVRLIDNLVVTASQARIGQRLRKRHSRATG